MTTFSLTKAFDALLGSLDAEHHSAVVERVRRTGHLDACQGKSSTTCFWCAAATMTPEMVTAAALWDSLNATVTAPLDAWPSAIRARMAIYDLSELSPPSLTHAGEFTAAFFDQLRDLGRRVGQSLERQGHSNSALEVSARRAAAMISLPRMVNQLELAPKNARFRTHLANLAPLGAHQLETMAILASEQLLAGQFMEQGANGRALADLARYLGQADADTFRDLAWVAGYYARRDQLMELAEQVMDLEEPTIVVAIPPVVDHYRLSALQALVLRAQPIDWVTTFVHVTGATGWKHEEGFLVTPSTALALAVWRDRHCASAIGVSK